MPQHRTPRRHAASSAPERAPLLPVRRRGGPFARHLRSGPRFAVVSGVAAALLLGPPLGLTVATMTGEVGPEHAGPFGPVVTALPWYQSDPQGWLAAHGDRDDRDDSSLPRAGADGPPADGAEATAPSGAAEPPASPATEEPAAAPEPTPAQESAPPEPQPDAEAPAPASDAPAADGGAGEARASGGAAAAPAGAPASASAAGPGAPTAQGTAVLELTNAERAQAGCGPLASDERLTAAAQLHSEDMDANGYMDHTSLDGRSPWDRAKAQGYQNPGAENVAKGYRTAADVVHAWMSSPGHRANILNCDLRELGVGHANGAWTQLFGWG